MAKRTRRSDNLGLEHQDLIAWVQVLSEESGRKASELYAEGMQNAESLLRKSIDRLWTASADSGRTVSELVADAAVNKHATARRQVKLQLKWHQAALQSRKAA